MEEKIKSLIKDEVCLGTYGLVELELRQFSKLFTEARDLLVMCSSIDKSGQCSELVDKMDRQLKQDK